MDSNYLCSSIVEYDLLCFYVELNRPAEILAGVFGASSEFLFNAEDLVVLGETLGAARSAGLDLTGRQTHDKVSNEGVFSLSRPGDQDTILISTNQQWCT